MPRKINKRKAVQTAKRKAADDLEARQNRHWKGTRRLPSDGQQAPRRVGVITNRSSGLNAALLAMLIGRWEGSATISGRGEE